MEEEKIMTEEEIRSDLVDQMTEAEDSVSYDPVEISDSTDGANVGLITGLTALGAGVITGGIILAKKIKSGAVKQTIENIKTNNEIRKDKRQAKKEIKARAKDEIKALYHPVEEKPAETPEVVEAELVEVKGTSKKK